MTKPDVIVIVLDDMRAQDWTALAHTRELIGGTFFTDFTCNTPVCSAGRATLLTGCYAHTHGVRRNEGPNGGRRAFRAHEASTLATLLRADGYHTALVGKYINGYEKRQPDPIGWAEFHPSDPPRYGQEQARKRARAIAIAGQIRAEPLFLWYAPKAPHGPIDGIERSELRPGRYDEYDAGRRASLGKVDAAVASIAGVMGTRWADAVVVVVSDNGYLLGEHGLTGKGQPWSPSTGVPALIRVPGLPSVGNDARMGSSVDIAPTILTAVGIPVPPWMDGRPLQVVDPNERAALIEGWPDGEPPWFGVRTADWLYYERAGRPYLYNRVDDPGERTDVALATDPVVIDALARMTANLRAR